MLDYKILKLIFGPFVSLYIRKINGLKNLPSKGPFIMVSNHNSSPDDLAITYLLAKKKFTIGAITAFRPYKNSFFNKYFIKIVEKILKNFFVLVSIYEKNPIENSVKAINGNIAFFIFPDIEFIGISIVPHTGL